MTTTGKSGGGGGPRVTQLIHRMKSGDDEAATMLWEHYEARLRAVAKNMLEERGGRRRILDEDDVVVRAFNSLFTRAKNDGFPQLENRRNFWNLLVGIARNKARSQIRKEKRTPERGESIFFRSPVPDGSEAGLQAILADDAGRDTPEVETTLQDLLRHFLERLEDPQLREILVLKLEGRTNGDIARELNVTRRTIIRRLNLIRARLADLAETRETP